MREWTFDTHPTGDGPWADEPDKRQWIDEATDLDCLMVRHGSSGHWCGYVGVPPGHPWHGKDYGDLDVSVHGGLTYADFCMENAGEEAICHVPEPGRPDHVWWLGFDCGHAWDRRPGMEARELRWGFAPSNDEVYRDLPYVEAQVRLLAVQVANAR